MIIWYVVHIHEQSLQNKNGSQSLYQIPSDMLTIILKHSRVHSSCKIEFADILDQDDHSSTIIHCDKLGHVAGNNPI